MVCKGHHFTLCSVCVIGRPLSIYRISPSINRCVVRPSLFIWLAFGVSYCCVFTIQVNCWTVCRFSAQRGALDALWWPAVCWFSLSISLSVLGAFYCTIYVLHRQAQSMGNQGSPELLRSVTYLASQQLVSNSLQWLLLPTFCNHFTALTILLIGVSW